MHTPQTHILKRALVYLMLLIYVTGLIKPVMPVVKDLVAHTFYKMEHMATIHFENGKYHMHVELQQEAQKGDPQKTPAFNDNESLSSHIKSEDLVFNMALQQVSEISSPYVDACMDVLIPMPILPPRC